ncbi:ERI1 exoribonuclease 2 [Fagus crenata]
MQKYSEAYMTCLKSKALPYKLQYNRDLVEGSPQAKDGIRSRSGGGFVELDRSFSSPSFVPPTEGYYRPINQQDFYVWSAFHTNSQKAQQNQFCALESRFSPMNHEYNFPMDDRFKSVPFRMSSQGYQPGFQFQEFQYFVVIDFEATCDKEKNPQPQEIIEFPSVLVNSMTGQVEDYFQIYVRPTCNQLLSDFCKELTGIQQGQVDKGVLLSEALLLHDKWLEGKGIKRTNFAVVTWSNWDCQVMLESECRLKRIRKPPYFNRWINLRVPFHEVFGAVKCNLKEAVQLAGLVWEGRAHCGLDDAKNTARLLAHLMHRGFRYSITDSLMCQPAECSFPMQRFLDCQSVYAQQSFRIKHPSLPFIQCHPFQVDPSKELGVFCYCGAKSSKQMVQKPGPKHGSCFFGCGNWTATRGALCSFFKWATP